MSRTAIEKKVGDYTYRLTEPSYKQALPVFTVVLNRLGAALRQAGPDLGEVLKGGDLSGPRLAKLVSSFGPMLETLSAQDFELLANTMIANCELAVEGGRWVPLASMADDHFAGRMMHLVQVLAAWFQHGFADFFADARSLVSPDRASNAAAPSPSTSPDGSTGKSKES